MKQLRRVTRALVALILCAVSLPSMAQSDSPKLVVWQKNGEKVVFDLDKLPETTFGGGVLTIKTTTATVSYQLSNILRYTYENVKETGVELQPADRSIKITTAPSLSKSMSICADLSKAATCRGVIRMRSKSYTHRCDRVCTYVCLHFHLCV